MKGVYLSNCVEKSQKVFVDKRAKSMYNIKCYNELKVGITFKFILAFRLNFYKK